MSGEWSAVMRAATCPSKSLYGARQRPAAKAGDDRRTVAENRLSVAAIRQREIFLAASAAGRGFGQGVSVSESQTTLLRHEVQRIRPDAATELVFD